MSIKISSLVWEHYPASGCELLTALAYADHAHDDGTNIRPSVAYIAKKTRQSERNVRRYLAQMRERGWLLTVRNGNGGRGFATEYRVNPLWITNPDNLSPFLPKADETLTHQAQKDDNRGSKRVTPASAQPLGTIKESTTAQNEKAPPLVFPDGLSGTNRLAAQKLIRQCPAEQRQLVLDEVAALISAGRVRNPIGLLRKLVEVAQQGRFVSNAKERQRKLSTTAGTRNRHSEQEDRIGRQTLRELLELLKRQSGPKRRN
ncbi:hypothetical protein [Pseudomonas panipatensis]|uniref:Helix-turn-helix domain-containing protein n=1 Tax=Pseudomonas panipatensis TaxID=428992 RepID=A0A1G8JDS6_9PSED|nr:hypothetical protein [Pseudomonas panipatensis]SDI29201.1 hypothetical protein SAMN05216272_107320 [Pseudomonas panipatensis]SMP50987.1 hypothetical protein SAMN06295951_102552 [Pseudomonas panipatensis]